MEDNITTIIDILEKHKVYQGHPPIIVDGLDSARFARHGALRIIAKDIIKLSAANDI